VQASDSKELQNKRVELETAVKNERHKLERVKEAQAGLAALPASGGSDMQVIHTYMPERPYRQYRPYIHDIHSCRPHRPAIHKGHAGHTYSP
jgi:hypothetical protein